MREILFRGKRLDSGEWCYGYIVKRPSAVHIGTYNPWAILVPPKDPDDNGGEYWVDPSTVGQYTGLMDKNGTRIFEGDTVDGVSLHGVTVKGVIEFHVGAFGAAWDIGSAKEFEPFVSILKCDYKVIGNIHDNKTEDGQWTSSAAADGGNRK